MIVIDPTFQDWEGFQMRHLTSRRSSIQSQRMITLHTDADHPFHQVTQQSVTGTEFFANGAPVRWVHERQKTVETSMHGSELVAVHVGMELILKCRHNLRMLGVKVDGPTPMLGGNESVMSKALVPLSMLKKKHAA